MNGLRTKIVRVFLFLTLLVPYAGGICWFHLEKKQIRRELKQQMLSGINKDDLVFLKFATDELSRKVRWKHSREFEFEGEMFDVVEKLMVGDTTFFWCKWDHRETRLNQELDQLLARTLGRQHPDKHYLLTWKNFFSSLYCSKVPAWFTFQPRDQQISFFLLNAKIPPVLSPPVPPPEIWG